MKAKRKRTPRSSAFALQALKALRIAVAKAIEEHRRSGDPIVVWEKGRVVWIPARKLPYRKSSRRPASPR